MRKAYYKYGYELGNGKFNEIGAAWTLKAAKEAAKELEDDEIVIKKAYIEIKGVK